MKATVLIDNIPDNGCVGEWGLAVYIEYENHKILLDCGTTGDFVLNAQKLGINLEEVECGVLSHAHYDHSDGMDRFFEINGSADFYLRECGNALCYSGTHGTRKKYIGIKKSILENYGSRLKYVSGDYELFPGVTLVPHKTEGLEEIGEKALMYVRKGRKYIPDSFAHEQSIVFDTPKGLVVFNSCSHGGADNIINEVSKTFPNKRIYAMIGGFHLFMTNDEEVLAFAKRVRKTGIEKVITGHCTGDRAYEILKKELGSKVEQMRSGMVIDFVL